MAPIYPNDPDDIQGNLLRAKRGADMATDVAQHLTKAGKRLRAAIDALSGCEALGEDEPLCDLRARLWTIGQELEQMASGVAGSAQLRSEAVTHLTKLMAEVADAAKEAA